MSSYETDDADPRYESRTTVNNNGRGRALTLPSGGYPVTRYPVNDDTVRKVRRVTRQKDMIVLLFERADRKATAGVSHNGRDPCSPHLETIAMRFQKRFCHGHATTSLGFRTEFRRFPRTGFSFRLSSFSDYQITISVNVFVIFQEVNDGSVKRLLSPQKRCDFTNNAISTLRRTAQKICDETYSIQYNTVFLASKFIANMPTEYK